MSLDKAYKKMREEMIDWQPNAKIKYCLLIWWHKISTKLVNADGIVEKKNLTISVRTLVVVKCWELDPK